MLPDPVDPELLGYVKLLEEFDPISQVDEGEGWAARARAVEPEFFKPWLEGPAVQQHLAPVEGSEAVQVFVINADHRKKRPAILHLHGGGYYGGSAAGSVADMQVQAGALDCVVATVEYRLAPEHQFPAALDDAYGALAWLYANADQLGIDRTRIALQGESAGGGLAAMLAIESRRRSEMPLCLQVLIYPMLDDRTASVREVAGHIGNIVWTRAANVRAWRAFLGREPGSRDMPQGSVPAREVDLSGLPAAFVATAGLDLFVDENIEYARRLNAAGVPTELLVVPGAFHAFDFFAPDSRAGRSMRLAMLNAYARAFGLQPISDLPQPAPYPPAIQESLSTCRGVQTQKTGSTSSQA